MNTKKKKNKQNSDSCKEIVSACNVIETCKLYPYLGSLISSNRQFELNISELCKSASRAMYTILDNVNKFSSGDVTKLLDFFNKIFCLFAVTTVNYGVLLFSI